MSVTIGTQRIHNINDFVEDLTNSRDTKKVL